MAKKKPKKLQPTKKAEEPTSDAQEPQDTQGGDNPGDTKADTENAQNAANGFTEQEIRDKGWAIEVPFELPDPEPARLRYSADGKAEKWEVPEGLEMGGIPWDQLPPLLSEQGQAEGGPEQDAGKRQGERGPEQPAG